MIPNIETIALERMQHAVQAHLSQEALMDSLNIVSYIDIISKDLCMSMRYSLLGRSMDEIKYPTDWKQAFKERWFPKWLLKKYPVKYRIINVKEYYPKIAIPKHEHFVRFERSGVF